jgi:hypothetical protein
MTEQANFIPIKKGLKVPQTTKSQPVRCGYCPALIFKQLEVGNRLHIINGFPACVRCRIMRSKQGLEISRDKDQFETDVKEKETRAQEAENQDVRVVAYESQIATDTAISKPKQ